MKAGRNLHQAQRYFAGFPDDCALLAAIRAGNRQGGSGQRRRIVVGAASQHQALTRGVLLLRTGGGFAASKAALVMRSASSFSRRSARSLAVLASTRCAPDAPVWTLAEKIANKAVSGLAPRRRHPARNPALLWAWPDRSWTQDRCAAAVARCHRRCPDCRHIGELAGHNRRPRGRWP